MAAWRVPGAAVVVVQGDRVEYLAGRAHWARAVTPDTIFPLASCSKAFTVEAMARLVAEGTQGWDDPVRRYLRWFRLSDPEADAQGDPARPAVPPHRRGEPRPALVSRPLVAGGGRPPAALPRASKPFRSTMQYQSTMFTAAGLAVAAADGQAVGRGHPRPPARPAGHDADLAGLPRATRSRTRPAAPARGRTASSRCRATRWTCPTRRGRSTPRRATSAPGCACSWRASRRRRLMWTRADRDLSPPKSQIQLALPGDAAHAGTATAWAGSCRTTTASTSSAHGGAIDGFRVHVALVPSRRLGIAVLTNLDQTPMPPPLASTLIDQILSLPPTDWHALHRAASARVADEARNAMARRFASRPEDARPPRPLSAYAGTYSPPRLRRRDVRRPRRQARLRLARRGGGGDPRPRRVVRHRRRPARHRRCRVHRGGATIGGRLGVTMTTVPAGSDG